VLRDADRAGGHAQSRGGLVGGHSDGDPQGEDLLLLGGQGTNEGHGAAGLVADHGQLLRSGGRVGAVGQLGDGLRPADELALSVDDLASRDRVDERLERKAAVVEGAQTGVDRHAHLLRHVLGDVLGSEASEPRPCVPQGQLPYASQ